MARLRLRDLALAHGHAGGVQDGSQRSQRSEDLWFRVEKAMAPRRECQNRSIINIGSAIQRSSLRCDLWPPSSTPLAWSLRIQLHAVEPVERSQRNAVGRFGIWIRRPRT